MAQEARRRSGRLGGRPRKPTADEARAAALEELVPKAISVLREHLESGRPDAWRPALKVLEHAWGRPPDQAEVEVTEPSSVDLTALSLEQLQAMRDKVLAENPHLATGPSDPNMTQAERKTA